MIFSKCLCCLATGFLALGLSAQTLNQLREELKEPIPQQTDAYAQLVMDYYHQAIAQPGVLESLSNIRYHGVRKEGNFERQFVLTCAPGGKLHLELIHEMKFKTDRQERAYNGSSGWTLDHSADNPYPRDMNASSKAKFFMHFSPFLLPGWDNTDYVYQYQGPLSRTRQNIVLVKAYRPDGIAITHFFNTSTYLKMRSGWREIYTGTLVPRDVYFTRYRLQEGIWIPEAINIHLTDKPFGSFDITKVETNVALAEDFFEKPVSNLTTLRSEREAAENSAVKSVTVVE